MSLHSIKANISGLISKKTFQGKSHLVLPVVILTEGVHCGSSGCFYYPPEELQKHPESWNGRPVPIRHPTINGIPISCNAPDVYEHQVVGQLFNTQYIDGKLKSEIWMNEEICKKNFPDVYQHLISGSVMDVSTGLWSDAVEESGVWNGKVYNFAVANIKPDHLALLPDEIGACSIKDGCGTPRINNKGGDCMETASTLEAQERSGLKKAFSILANTLGFKVTDPIIEGEDPASPLKTPVKENSMTQDKKKELVDAIINAGHTYTEECREALSSLNEGHLLKIQTLQKAALDVEETKKESDTTQKKDEPTTNAETSEEKKEDSKLESKVENVVVNSDVLKSMTEQIVNSVVGKVEKVIPELVQKSLDTNESISLIADLKANKECPLGEQTLKTLPVSELKALHQKFCALSDFSLMGGTFSHNAEKEEEDKNEMPSIMFNSELWKRS